MVWMSLKAKDIARLAGVSPATVSIVLNNKPGVSDAKRTEIINLINSHGCEYLLKNDASNGNLGFVVFQRVYTIINESPFYSFFIEGISAHAMERGYSLMHINLNYQMSTQEIARILHKNRCKGLFVFGAEMQLEDIQKLQKVGIPFVILDNRFVETDCNAVCINNTEGIFAGVAHLASLGHKKIGFIQGLVQINSFQERLEAFRTSMAHFGLAVREKHIFHLSYPEGQGINDMKRAIQQVDSMPTALLSANDLLAISAFRGLQESGYRIPDDISIVGFDGRPSCLYIDPQLTTVSVPTEAFAPYAIQLLMNSMQGNSQHITIQIGVKLIARGSSSLVPAPVQNPSALGGLPGI